VTVLQDTSFEYQQADCWEEAIELLTLWQGEGKILAGGQSLVPMLNLRLAAPPALIDITPIRSDGPYVDGHDLVIPATTRHVDVLRSELVQQHCPLLVHAVGLVGNARVRNRGTVGGSLAHADPTGEIPCTVLACHGRIVLQGPAARRSVDAADFFRTYLTTVTEPDEVVTELRLPVPSPRSTWGFEEKVRRFSDFATVEVAVTGELDRDRQAFDTVTVVLGGVADVPVTLPDGVTAPVRGEAARTHVRSVAAQSADSVSPESDVHASSDYRRHLVRVLTERALMRTLERQHGGSRT
jgi:CO/xanthine dehydrogenase FAD-binding subunit